MPSQKSPVTPHPEPRGDAWHAFGYLVSGVLIYGVLGWLADRWLGTTFLVAVGVVLGAALGLYSTWVRFNRPVQDLVRTGTTPSRADPPRDDHSD